MDSKKDQGLNIPAIEWPENGSEPEENAIIDNIVSLFEKKAKEILQERKHVLFISPEPARNIDNLLNLITANLPTEKIKDDSFRSIQYGYKDRAWGAFTADIELARSLLPVFFNHGAETLKFLAIEVSKEERENPSLLRQEINNIVFDGTEQNTSRRFSGLLFECDTLVSFIEPETNNH